MPDLVTLILFDVDGTLVDSQAIIVAALDETFAELGLPPPGPARGRAIIGLSLPEAFAALAGEGAPIADLIETFRQVFQRLPAHGGFAEALFPGAAETIAMLRARPAVALGLATGKSRRGVDHLIARQGWEGVFATIQTADDAPSKPHPAMVRQAMAETGVRAAETLMIGDSTYDMMMARGAHATAIGVTWGYHAADALRAAGAQTVVESYEALRELVEDRLARAA